MSAALVRHCAAQALQERTAVGRLLSVPLLSLALGLAAAALGILPTACLAYDAVWQGLMPLAAALYLLESDLRGLREGAGAVLAAFGVAVAGTLAGTLVAWMLLGARLDADGLKVAAALCGSYIGGSINFAAVAAALGLAPGPTLAAAMAADNIAMAAYLALVSLWPAGAEPGDPAAGTAGATDRGLEGAPLVMPGPAASAESMALSMAAGAGACAAGQAAAAACGLETCGLGFTALAASGAASAMGWAIRRRGGGAQKLAQLDTPFAGASALGGALMLLFFATIGAGAGSAAALGKTGWLAAFIAVQLGTHLAVVAAGARLFKLPIRETLTASNAAVGGPGTAAAMAAGRGWERLVQPALLTGSLGYAIGTGLGLAAAQVMRALPLLRT